MKFPFYIIHEFQSRESRNLPQEPVVNFSTRFFRRSAKGCGKFGEGMKRYKIELWQAICIGFPRLLEPVPSSVTNTRLASIIHVVHSTGKVKKQSLWLSLPNLQVPSSGYYFFSVSPLSSVCSSLSPSPECLIRYSRLLLSIIVFLIFYNTSKKTKCSIGFSW